MYAWSPNDGAAYTQRVNAAPWKLCAAILLVVACSEKSAPPDPQPSAGGGGGSEGGSGGAPLVCSVPEEDVYPPAFHMQQTCCNEGQHCHDEGIGRSSCWGGELQLCRGRCVGMQVGIGSNNTESHCHCGVVGFDADTQSSYGPGPCAEGSVCCRTQLGMGACTPEGACDDCRPEKSASPIVSVDCCFTATGSVPCRGRCDYQQACACGDIDGGCADGQECCRNIPLSDPPTECVPFGTCDHGPCPPEASSSSVLVSCCASFPCRGACIDASEGAELCVCGRGGPQWGCPEGEECCPNGDERQCVPVGQCPAP